MRHNRWRRAREASTIATPVAPGTATSSLHGFVFTAGVRKTGVFRTLNAWQIKGCVCSTIGGGLSGGISEQASMTMDMGKFSVLTSRRLPQALRKP
jgi:hypothetical protein